MCTKKMIQLYIYLDWKLIINHLYPLRFYFIFNFFFFFTIAPAAYGSF